MSNVMKRVQIQYAALFLVGIMFMSMNYILRDDVVFTDFSHGLMKGIGIGCAFLSLLFLARSRKTTSMTTTGF
jgi:hypothetical protein